MSGRSIGSSIARWIGIARGQVSFTWSSGKALTTPLMQSAGSHPNTLHMHLTWFKLSIGHTQTSLPSKSLWSGDRYFLTYTHHTLMHFICLEHFLRYFVLLYISDSQTILQLPILFKNPGHLSHGILYLHLPGSRLTHCPLLLQQCCCCCSHQPLHSV